MAGHRSHHDSAGVWAEIGDYVVELKNFVIFGEAFAAIGLAVGEEGGDSFGRVWFFGYA